MRNMRNMRNILALALVASLGTTAACGRPGRPSEAVAPAETTTVTVRNNRFYDMNVFVVRDGATRVRLGMVTGNSSARFTIPGYLVGFGATLRFIADPVGPSGVDVSENLPVQPGDRVQLDITP